LQLEDKMLVREGCSVVDIRTWVHSIKAGVAAWEESMREKYSKSLLGKYLIRKESSCIRKGLDLFVLEEAKVLNIHYIRMTCIHVGKIKQEQSI
jgi:hypothetical protein